MTASKPEEDFREIDSYPGPTDILVKQVTLRANREIGGEYI